MNGPISLCIVCVLMFIAMAPMLLGMALSQMRESYDIAHMSYDLRRDSLIKWLTFAVITQGIMDMGFVPADREHYQLISLALDVHRQPITNLACRDAKRYIKKHDFMDSVHIANHFDYQTFCKVLKFAKAVR